MEATPPPVNQVNLKDPQIGALEQSASDVPVAEAANELQLTLCLDLQTVEKIGFWLVCAPENRGGSVPETLAGGQLANVFDKVLQQGIAEPLPMVISEVQGDKALQIFLMPIPARDFRIQTIWVEDACRVISDWGTKKIGLYLDPGIMDETVVFEMIRKVIFKLAGLQRLDEVCLYVGKNDYNKFLNCALDIKAEMAEEQRTIKLLH